MIKHFKIFENQLQNNKYHLEKWYHYSNVDFLKLPTNPNHYDPVGIYLFPEYSIPKIKSYWKSKNFKFTVSLKPNLNILDLDKLTNEEELEIINKLDTKNNIALNTFKSNSSERGFWQYIRNAYTNVNLGPNCGYVSRKDFMKLGYDGIFSHSLIHSLEPQIIIFDPKNIEVENVEKREGLFNHLIRIKEDILRILNDEDGLNIKEEKISSIKIRDGKRVESKITVSKNNKSFSINIHYETDSRSYWRNGQIRVDISSYKRRNYSMGALVDVFEPNWEDFGTTLVRDLLTAVGDLDEN